LDTQAIIAVGRLRLCGAIACTASGAWIAAMSPGLLGWFVAIIAWLISLFWVVAYRSSLKAVQRDQGNGVLLNKAGVQWCKRGETLSLPWESISVVEIDEDRLILVLKTEDGRTHSLEPHYQGLSVYEMANRVHLHHGASQSANRH
jgi:hypothetical protein